MQYNDSTIVHSKIHPIPNILQYHIVSRIQELHLQQYGVGMRLA